MKIVCAVLALTFAAPALGLLAGKDAKVHFKPPGVAFSILDITDASMGPNSSDRKFASAKSNAVGKGASTALVDMTEAYGWQVAKLAQGSQSLQVSPDVKRGLENVGVTIVDHDDTHHHRNTVLFAKDDMVPWIVFTLSFFVLVIFDNAVLHRKTETLSLPQALLYTAFWISCAAAFNFYVYMTRGASDAFSWGTGYLLEWMLSVDNLFVFHRVFEIFQTPDEQKHKPLFYGIIGAIVFRMIFFLFGQLLMHHVWWIHIVFGLFLIYTGIKAVAADEDDNPTEGWLFQAVIKHINYVDRYDPEGRFFTPVEVPRDPEAATPNDEPPVVKYQATRLMLVVICLEITDVIFAVDSVSAIVAQIPDLFLAYTACVFAMLGLRAMFFAIHELVKMFTMLAYGVAFILVFLGLKLMLKSWIHFSPKLVCVILVGTIALSIAASLISDGFFLVTDETGQKQSPPATGRKRSSRSEYISSRSEHVQPPLDDKFVRGASGETGSTESTDGETGSTAETTRTS